MALGQSPVLWLCLLSPSPGSPFLFCSQLTFVQIPCQNWMALVVVTVSIREFQPRVSPRLKITKSFLTGDLVARLFLMLKRLKCQVGLLSDGFIKSPLTFRLK